VLLDVMMPDMDGFEVCRRLKASPSTHHLPVIMVTALDQISDRVKGLEAGADDFLTKPVSDLALVARVRSLVRLKMMTDELRMRNVPILAVAEPEDSGRLMRGLEIGINDYLMRPIDKNELLARVRTQIRKKRYTERLRDNVQMSIEAAITDALTTLHNRRYME